VGRGLFVVVLTVASTGLFGFDISELLQLSPSKGEYFMDEQALCRDNNQLQAPQAYKIRQRVKS
jgi:hypothetical protein